LDFDRSAGREECGYSKRLEISLEFISLITIPPPMPSPRDLTENLVQLRSKKALREPSPSPDEVTIPLDAQLRPMAFDPVLWISGLVILAGLATQGAFIAWMW